MSEPAEEAAVTARAARDGTAEELARLLGVGPDAAQLLASSGHTTVEEVRALTDESLTEIGISADDIRRIRTAVEARSADPPAPAPSEAPAEAAPSAVNGEKIVERWMDTVRKTERPKRRHVPVAAKDSAEVLRKWVQGDDRAMEAWIQASEPMRAPPPAAPVVVPRPVATAAPEAAIPAPMPVAPDSLAPVPPVAPTVETVAPAPVLLPAQVREREETVVKWLTDLLDRVKTDQFDPASLLQEVQELHRQLYEERAKRKQLDDELEHVKRGSIAVIKYVRSREAKTREQAIQSKDAEIAELKLKLLATGAGETLDPAAPPEGATEVPAAPGTEEAGPPAVGGVRELERRLRTDFEGRERQYVEREAELRRRIVQLEGEIRNLRSESDAAAEREGFTRQPGGELSEELARKLKEAEGREKDLVRRENELRTKFEEIRISADELERKRVPLLEKERELGEWERQVTENRQQLEEETRQVAAARVEVESTGHTAVSREELRRLEALKSEILHKEEEQKAREVFLNQKLEELEAVQRQIVAGEPEPSGPTLPSEVAEKKVKSGVRRLDDLLFGGYPPGSQILLNGPAHTGKEILGRLFVAEGLKAGIPALWVVTDKTYTQIREEMVGLYPGYTEAEQRGLVRYVDLYSRSLGVTQAEPGVRLLSSTDKSILDQLTQTVNSFSAELKSRAPTYRLVFESVSTVTAYLDTTATFRFLQPFAGRRKLDAAASYYLLETGMHSASDLQTLEHMMDGSINLKIDQLKTFLSVRGIADTQSRAWIGFTFSKKAFSLGSFSLDHIR